MTDEEAGAGEGTIGEAVAARVSDERKRGVSDAVPTAAGVPSSETGRDNRCTRKSVRGKGEIAHGMRKRLDPYVERAKSHTE